MRRLPLAVVLTVAGALAVVAGTTAGIAGAVHRPAPVAAVQAATAPSAAGGAAKQAAGKPVTVFGSNAEASGQESGGNDEITIVKRPTAVSAGRSRTGAVLVGDAGLTLYVFSADRNGVSACNGACARSWIPARSHGGKPRGSAAVPTALIGSVLRSDGSYQITLLRRPLYYYVGDRKPGDANGAGRIQFGGTWQIASVEEEK